MRISAFGTALLLVALTTEPAGQIVPFRSGGVFQPWAPGTLDIHQIVTGSHGDHHGI